MSFLTQLYWRAAIKRFNQSKQVSKTKLAEILRAVRLAPSSFGLQPWLVVVVSEPTLRQKMREYAFSQPQIVEASYLLVFCARIDIDQLIDKYIQLSEAGGKGEERKRFLQSAFKDKTKNELWAWAREQVFIALGFALAASAELKVDSCPMGGFESEQFDKLLGLPDYMQSVVLLAIGYRQSDSRRPKIRFSSDDLFIYK